jgi:tRNA(adenine34) deaminase
MKPSDHIWYMIEAIKEAEVAYRYDEVPIGAVVVDDKDKIISRAHNLKEKNFDPCGHAEILALQKAAKTKGNWRLTDCYLYVTLEPCPMCLSAMIHARIKGLIFGTYDSKGGSFSLNYNLYNDTRLNHQISVIGGIKHFECSRMLSNFFRQKRQFYKT